MDGVVGRVLGRHFLQLVVYKDGDGTGEKLNEVESKDGEWGCNGWIGGLKKIDEPRHAFLIVYAKECAKLFAWREVLNCSPVSHHVWPCWIIEDADQGCSNSSHHYC